MTFLNFIFAIYIDKTSVTDISLISATQTNYMRKLITIILLGSIAISLTAQKQKKTEETKTVSSINYDSVFQALKWRCIGPFRGGRANAICGVPGNDQAFFVGYTGGGVSKTDDGGLHGAMFLMVFLKLVLLAISLFQNLILMLCMLAQASMQSVV